MNKLPPLNAINAFARVAETGSFAEAGRFLNVTPAAVSQQVRKLEEFFGLKLVQKHGRGVLLTEEGQVLSRAALNGLAQIQEGVTQISYRNASKSVRVTTSPSLAVHWLVPRISKFQMEHPDIAIQLDLTSTLRSLDKSGFDIAIRYCKWEDLPPSADVIKTVTLNALCPITLKPQQAWPSQPYSELPWLQEFGTSEIKGWFERHGDGLALPHRISEMPGNLIMEALKRGEAVAYVVCDWMIDEINSGRLCELIPQREKGAYHIVNSPSTNRREAEIFQNWLKKEMQS